MSKITQDLRGSRAKLAACLLAMEMLALSGCGLSVNNPSLFSGSTTPAPANTGSSTQLHGHVGGTQWAASASTVQLYAVGTQGTRSQATPLLALPVETDASGNFTIAGGYTCPSPSSQLYVVANGGTAGMATGSNNSSLSLMTMLGPCNALLATDVYPVNEVTTIASVWPLSGFMASATQLGSTLSENSFSAALNKIDQLIKPRQAVSPGIGIPAGYAVQTAKLYTLADDLHACVSSTGGNAGDGTPCGQLFSLATLPGSAPPKDTLAAALNLAGTNQLGVQGLFQFLPQNAPFQPVLASAPVDWNLDLVAIPAPPIIEPGTGAYAAGQSVTLSTNTAGASIRYTLDGSAPTPASAPYSSPLTLASSETINAIAVTEDISSAATTATLSLTPTANRPVAISLTPAQTTLTSSQTQQFAATVTGSSNTSVTWTLSPAIGTISASGFYTAPAGITSQATVTVLATSSADPTKAAGATVTLSPLPLVGVGLSPGSVSLAPGQTQAFTSTVTGTSNTTVTWTISPAVGTISATGFYTAPSSINGVEDITVTATSNADPSKVASATVSITPGGPAYLTYYVDNVSGNDANNGTTETTPFATVAKVNTLNLFPGQTVAFKAEDTWHETLAVSQSGSAGAPIRYTSYGYGKQPVIDASDTVTGWTSGDAGLPATVWSHPQTTSPLLINFSGTAGVPVASKTTISEPYQFAWDGWTLYVYSTSDPTPTVEVAARVSALASGNATYVTVSNLELRGGRDTVFCHGAGPCTNWDFEGNTIDSAGAVGLRWLPNPGVNGGNLTVNNNTIRGTGGAGIGVSNGGSNMGDVISNNTVTDACKIYIAGSQENSYCDAINAYSATGTDGGGKILNNNISQVGLASGAAYGGGIHADTVVNWDIEHNTVSNTNFPGITLEKGSGSTVRYNLLVNTGQRAYFSGLFIRAGDGLNVSKMLAEYNTVVGGYWACALSIWPNQGAVTATDITVSKNICTGSASGTQFFLDPGFADTGNTFANNGFGVPSAAFVTAGHVPYGAYSLLPSPITASIGGDPQFTAPGNGNYTLLPTSPDRAIGAFPQP